MRRLLPVVAVAAVCFAAGLALGKDPHLRRLNLPGRNDKIPFTHAVVAGKTVYLAGTLGLDPKTKKPPSDPKAEAKLALEGMRKKLALAGGRMTDLVSVQVFCSDTALYGAFNEVYGTYFPSGAYPTRAFIGSGPLLRGAHFEVTGIAVLE